MSVLADAQQPELATVHDHSATDEYHWAQFKLFIHFFQCAYK